MLSVGKSNRGCQYIYPNYKPDIEVIMVTAIRKRYYNRLETVIQGEKMIDVYAGSLFE